MRAGIFAGQPRKNDFFAGINYSSCNEDPNTELEALNIGSADHVACITGSGDRPLHMLLGEPAHVYAFDVNRVQNFLLELKIAAIRKLDYAEYAGFLGVTDHLTGPERKTLYRKLREELSADCKNWFDSHQQPIGRGVLYSGRWEQYFYLSSRCIRLWRRNKIDTLFRFSDVDSQRTFVEKSWDTRLWRLFLMFSFNTLVFRWLFGDPGFYSQVRPNFSPSAYIHRRMNSYLYNHLANESFMLALIFLGRFVSIDHYPPYLRPENFPVLKNRVDRISIHDLSLDQLLTSSLANRCNKFSLSDVSSFLDDHAYLNLFFLLAEQPCRRFCIRDFLANRGIPTNSPPNISFYPKLQEELAQKDRSIGYTFIIGETS